MEQAKLTDLGSHFAFGDNWKNFLRNVDDAALSRSEKDLRNLLPKSRIEGKSFLDIGCGSGLSSMAALRLGAKRIRAIDIDPASVAATRDLFARHAPDAIVETEVKSILDIRVEEFGQFDVVHSWGVLHHTGAMWEAIERATTLVKPKGIFVIAIYIKTKRCDFWKMEKRIYSSSPKWRQACIRGIYKLARHAKMLASGRNPVAYVRNYNDRGMSFHNDVHDWLGGYPYESATAKEILARVVPLGFRAILVPETPITRGWSGSQCAEYVFEKIG